MVIDNNYINKYEFIKRRKQMQQNIDSQMKLLKENQKKHIESFIEN